MPVKISIKSTRELVKRLKEDADHIHSEWNRYVAEMGVDPSDVEALAKIAKGYGAWYERENKDRINDYISGLAEEDDAEAQDIDEDPQDHPDGPRG